MLTKKTILALAIGAGFALPAAAELRVGNWEFYGRAHLSADFLDDGANYSELNGSSNSSRLGFRGDKQIGSMTAIWQIEQEIFFNLNDSTKNFFASRDTFAGLKGSFGQVRFGKFDTPFKKAREAANLFGDQVGDMRNLTRFGNYRFDERLNNQIEYATPKFGGFQGVLSYAMHEGSTAAVDATGAGKDEQAISAALTYKAGKIDAALAFENYGKDAARGERDAVRLAVGVKATKDLKLVGFYQAANHKVDGDMTVTGVGAEYALTKKTYLRAHVFQMSQDKANADATLYAVGVEHRLDKALRVYANYGAVSNDPAAALNPWTQGRSTSVAGAAGKDSSALSFGFRYDF